jgi:hypothetical protein
MAPITATIVYQKDMGPDSDKIAAEMERCNPDRL